MKQVKKDKQRKKGAAQKLYKNIQIGKQKKKNRRRSKYKNVHKKMKWLGLKEYVACNDNVFDNANGFLSFYETLFVE